MKKILLMLVLCLAGCRTTDMSLYVEKTTMERNLDELKHKRDANETTAVKNIETAKNAELEQIASNFQNTADELFAAHIALDVETDKSRPVLIADTHVTGAIAFAPKPTLDSVLKNQKLLKDELDLQKTTNADITARLNNTLVVASKAQIDLKEKEEAIKTAVADKAAIMQIDSDKIAKAQEDLNTTTNKVIAAQKENLVDKAARNKERMWLIGIFTFVGIAFGVAAIFSPILKKQLTIGAGAALAIAVGIVLVPQWVITTFACAVFTGLLLWVLNTMLVSHKAAENTYRAIQEVKQTDAATFEKLKPVLVSWQSKYTKEGVVEDPATKAHIESVLKSTDSL